MKTLIKVTARTASHEAMHCRSGRLAVLVLVLSAMAAAANAADTNNGSRLYARHCVSCHGGSGAAAAPGSPSFERGQNLLRPDVVLMEATRVGKNAMPAYQGILTTREILDVIAFMRTLH